MGISFKVSKKGERYHYRKHQSDDTTSAEDDNHDQDVAVPIKQQVNNPPLYLLDSFVFALSFPLLMLFDYPCYSCFFFLTDSPPN